MELVGNLFPEFPDTFLRRIQVGTVRYPCVRSVDRPGSSNTHTLEKPSLTSSAPTYEETGK